MTRRAAGIEDPQKVNRRVAAVLVLVVGALAGLTGLLLRSPGAVGFVIVAPVVVCFWSWSATNRRRRLDGDLPYTAIEGAWSPWRALLGGSGNPRYAAGLSEVPDEPPPGESRSRQIYVFCDNQLLATLSTRAARPERNYRIGTVDYAVVSYVGPYVEAHGSSEAFDVQVARPGRPDP